MNSGKRPGDQTIGIDRMQIEPRMDTDETRIKPETKKESKGKHKPRNAHGISICSLPNQGRNNPTLHDTVHPLSVFHPCPSVAHHLLFLYP
jgi:hypothetical protein